VLQLDGVSPPWAAGATPFGAWRPLCTYGAAARPRALSHTGVVVDVKLRHETSINRILVRLWVNVDIRMRAVTAT